MLVGKYGFVSDLPVGTNGTLRRVFDLTRTLDHLIHAVPESKERSQPWMGLTRRRGLNFEKESSSSRIKGKKRRREG
jgi:hypothetical protein